MLGLAFHTKFIVQQIDSLCLRVDLYIERLLHNFQLFESGKLS